MRIARILVYSDMVVLMLSKAEEGMLGLLAQRLRLSPVQYAVRLVRRGMENDLAALPHEMARAVEIIANDIGGGGERTRTSEENGNVEYEVSRLRFVKSRIERLSDTAKLRIHVADEGTFEFTLADLERDFENVLRSRSYNESGFYHYSVIPAKALKYRISEDNPNER